ncbi:MAG: hypothetical protein IPO08_22150 [Xanthomonadales bacterium]|nr:hypothetical protein [Xanthomonadales bacterium]
MVRLDRTHHLLVLLRDPFRVPRQQLSRHLTQHQTVDHDHVRARRIVSDLIVTLVIGNRIDRTRLPAMLKAGRPVRPVDPLAIFVAHPTLDHSGPRLGSDQVRLVDGRPDPVDMHRLIENGAIGVVRRMERMM